MKNAGSTLTTPVLFDHAMDDRARWHRWLQIAFGVAGEILLFPAHPPSHLCWGLRPLHPAWTFGPDGGSACRRQGRRTDRGDTLMPPRTAPPVGLSRWWEFTSEGGSAV